MRSWGWALLFGMGIGAMVITLIHAFYRPSLNQQFRPGTVLPIQTVLMDGRTVDCVIVTDVGIACDWQVGYSRPRMSPQGKP